MTPEQIAREIIESPGATDEMEGAKIVALARAYQSAIEQRAQCLAEVERPDVKVHVGTSALSRDLVWCECGRGLSTRGFWHFCPRCGGKIDQDSYRSSCEQAERD